jgi:superfamily I DNA/RNA helicase
MLYDWIILDEAQDLSVCQREIILKCRKINTRMLFFGDSEQALYSFASSDPESFKMLKELPNTTSLPLSISYRCAKNIVDFAQKIVPTIEANNDGREGEVKYNVSLDEIKDGDMVLCRNNAPLMQVYVDFIKKGKKCFIRGKDIGLNLKNMVKRTGIDVLNKSLQEDGVFVRLYDALFDMINETICKYNVTYADAVESASISNRLDMIKALEILSDDINTANELIEKISNIFSDRKKGGISLSTIHKAKGLEADNVYIACRHLMPSSRAKKDWEIRQEYNLMYVAYTRPKNILGFIDDKEFESFTKKTSETVGTLKKIENQVNYVLKKDKRKVEINNAFIANDIIRHATKIEKPKTEYKVMPMMKEGNTSGIGFNDIFKRRYIKNEQ